MTIVRVGDLAPQQVEESTGVDIDFSVDRWTCVNASDPDGTNSRNPLSASELALIELAPGKSGPLVRFLRSRTCNAACRSLANLPHSKGATAEPRREDEIVQAFAGRTAGPVSFSCGGSDLRKR